MSHLMIGTVALSEDLNPAHYEAVRKNSHFAIAKTGRVIEATPRGTVVVSFGRLGKQELAPELLAPARFKSFR